VVTTKPWWGKTSLKKCQSPEINSGFVSTYRCSREALLLSAITITQDTEPKALWRQENSFIHDHGDRKVSPNGTKRRRQEATYC
jgi:hypothetical protein